MFSEICFAASGLIHLEVIAVLCLVEPTEFYFSNTENLRNSTSRRNNLLINLRVNNVFIFTVHSAHD